MVGREVEMSYENIYVPGISKCHEATPSRLNAA